MCEINEDLYLDGSLHCPFGYYNDDGECKVEVLNFEDPLTQ